MRKGLLTSVATALVGAGSALAQNPYYLPTDGQAGGIPALLSAEPMPAPAAARPAAPPALTGGSTGLVPGVDCLPAAAPPQPRFYGDIAYMLTWVKNGHNPGPLAVTAPSAAALFGPGTTAVIGGRDTEFDGQNGARVNIGMWLGCENKIGFEVGGFILEQGRNGSAVTTDGGAANPVLARPFVNLDLVPPALDAIIVGGPGLAGAIIERETTRLWGVEANGVLNWRDDCHRRTDLLAGFGYTDLRETLGITSTTTNVGNPALATFSTVLDDAVNTRNQFYAGQVGARTTWTFGKLSLAMTGKIALGVNHETVDRFGNSTFTFPGAAPFSAPGGFLTQSSNAGRLNRDQFAVGLPSQILLGYQVTDHLNAFLGYDFIYISNVVRPGDQVDLTSQTNPLTGAAIRPVGGIHTTDFWANSLLAGMSFKF
jgi:hypothetical protein